MISIIKRRKGIAIGFVLAGVIAFFLVLTIALFAGGYKSDAVTGLGRIFGLLPGG